jgi:DNA-binding NarL/FixJ family response regulator
MRNIAIVHDHPMTRAALERLIAASSDCAVVASVDCVDELNGPETTYDGVVLDLDLRSPRPALDAIAGVARLGSPLVISDWEHPASVLAAVRAGARGCVTRRSQYSTVDAAIQAVAHGGFYLCPRLADRFHEELSRSPQSDPAGLAPREIETLQFIAQGLTYGQIATQMGLSPTTVNTYAKRIRTKLKVTNKAEITRIAVELGHRRADRVQDRDSYGLAPREVETLEFIAQGLTYAQIAVRMGVSHATVDTYAKRIRSKLNVTNSADITRMAIEFGHSSGTKDSMSAFA